MPLNMFCATELRSARLYDHLGAASGAKPSTIGSSTRILMMEDRLIDPAMTIFM